MTNAREARAPQPPPLITPYSKLGTPAEGWPWWAPFGWLLVAFFTLLFLAVMLLFSPIILLVIVARKLQALTFRYHRPPGDLRIAIVGAGWSGLQALQRFKEIGVDKVDVFERYDDIAGTWHPNLAYHGLQIHGSMTVTSFDRFPYSTDRDVQGGKVMAAEVNRYIHKFAEAHELRPHVRFNANVEGLSYVSKGRKATVSLADTTTGAKSESGPYDLVIWASMAAFGNVPRIEGAETFRGKQLHTSQYPTAVFEDIVRTNKRVVVVGGGKASADIVLGFRRAGYTNFQWVLRKPYLFYRFEALLHDASPMNMVRGLTYLSTVLWTGLSKRLGAILHWSSGHLYTFGKPHTDFTHFHGGVMCATQRRDISDIPYTIGEPVKFTPDGVILDDGTAVPCDVVIWGTGNKSGIDTLKIEKDGVPFHLDPKAKLYNHFIVPEVPALASSTALWTTFGPTRATNSADLAVHHLCVRKQRSEEQMKRAARRQLSTNSILHSFLWAKGACWLQQWVYFHIDLVLAGITPIDAFLKHGLEIFVLSRLTPLDFNLLPPRAIRKTSAVPQARSGAEASALR